MCDTRKMFFPMQSHVRADISDL